MAGAVQHRGAQVRRDATEGGSHPEEGTHPCHNPHCAHNEPPQPPQPSRRNRARKVADQKREHLIASRFNNAEKADLLAAASACAMTPSGFLAHAALRAARDLTRTAAEVAGEREVIDELFALRRNLNQIGNNLNQVAKAINSGADVPYATTVLESVHRAARRVDTFTQMYLDTETRAG
ncbi:plasmid mobilization protein [Streptomyces sp. H27-C3]|uniref:plasmid mobilization protein n=1 Tax=unclassified Streptomyces TaxID=2593676 RepID=UPI0024BABD62|nr:plasmid mobilization relaxosome protein MobC [Streptomyces sp. H27-C3]MDJ0464650.1 plasmid mobilization relaxosome protein MobC [Streptomyces sp. H27-C3]